MISKKKIGESENEVEEFLSRGNKVDELDRYLNLIPDKSKLESDPLAFLKEQQDKFYRLSQYARCVHSIRSYICKCGKAVPSSRFYYREKKN